MTTKLVAGLAALAALAGAPALAQTPAAPSASATVAVTTGASAALSVENTPIETLVANEKAKAVLDKELPGMTEHPAYAQFKAMTLSQLAPMSQGAIDDAKLKAIQAELDKAK